MIAKNAANPHPNRGAPFWVAREKEPGRAVLLVPPAVSHWPSSGSSLEIGGGSAQPLRGESTAGAVGPSGLSPASRPERAGGCASGPGESHRAPSDPRCRIVPLLGPSEHGLADQVPETTAAHPVMEGDSEGEDVSGETLSCFLSVVSATQCQEEERLGGDFPSGGNLEHAQTGIESWLRAIPT